MSIDLVTTPPQGSHTVPISATWGLAVEIAVPDDASQALWGTARWDQATWSVPTWRGITTEVQGIDIQRGSDPTSRPQIGLAIIELDNTNNQFSRWNDNGFTPPRYFEPGTLIRISLLDISNDVWEPLFTGIVEDWTEVYEDSTSNVAKVVITAIETLTLLARINDLATTEVGEGETPTQRIQRLLNASDWPYGLISETARTTPLQATNLSELRIAEAYTVADSIDAVLRTAASGQAYLYDKDANSPNINYTGTEFVLSHQQGTNAGVVSIPYVDASLTTSNNDDILVNRIALACRGGTAQTYEDATSQIFFGIRTYTRSELWYQEAQAATASAYIANRMLDRAAVYRPFGCQLDASVGPDVMAFMAGIDVGDVLDVVEPNVHYYNVGIANLHHRMTPIPSGVVWTLDLTFTTTKEYSWQAS